MSDDEYSLKEELKNRLEKGGSNDNAQEREMVQNVKQSLTSVLGDIEQSATGDAKRAIKEHLRQFGAPDDSLKNEDVLREIAKHMNVAHADLEDLKEAVEQIRNEDDLIAEMVENNLRYFGDE